ncbi:unnamed protein product [Brachionus calyciflorus]|uniref:SCP domain-containing protein n=1 Tax=Brachionus calyciflorus TaxID=104777 RepID=A0A813PEV9_9BILA|nr:unnamed protein product [Brachionus calyciflorus]
MKLLTRILILCLIVSIALGASTYIKPSKRILDEYELDQLIKMNLDRARHGYPKIEYNLNLMDAAQYAANQLSRRGDLETPYLRTCNRYMGYAYKYQGYLQSARKFFGSKICFNNFYPYASNFVYDVLFDCTPKSIKVYDFDEYGYATSFDREGNAYLVRLFTLRGNMGSSIGSSFDPSSMDSSKSSLGSANPFARSLNTSEIDEQAFNATQRIEVNKNSTTTTLAPSSTTKFHDEEKLNFKVEFLKKSKSSKSFKN